MSTRGKLVIGGLYLIVGFVFYAIVRSWMI